MTTNRLTFEQRNNLLAKLEGSMGDDDALAAEFGLKPDELLPEVEDTLRYCQGCHRWYAIEELNEEDTCQDCEETE